MQPNRVKRILRDGGLALGTYVGGIADPQIVEIIGHAGFDAAFIDDLPAGVDACGENGEFHTFVFDGPRFARPVPHELVAVHEIRQSAPALGHHFVAELR